jgi:histidyl-tRNA synthetase
MKVPIPPGVFDIVPNEEKEPWRNSHLWFYVESVMRETAKQYGFLEIRTPIFERAELFNRSVGETSDIISKEMYLFEDRGGRLMALRPESTAPVMRAFVDNQLQTQGQIHKLFYIGPMFRYDRPQAGRYRQHHQFGAEAIGISSPEQDAELIDMLCTTYRRLGLKNLKVYLNSIGDTTTRKAYREALLNYLSPYIEKLSPESKTRYNNNPLRILDSKDPEDQALVANAPSILNFLDEESQAHFQKVQRLLTSLHITFEINPKLVRGLDYYNRTVFEIVSGDLGSQNSIGGGGRYDGLLKLLEGPDLPAIGFGTGIERIIQAMLKQGCKIPESQKTTLFLIPLGEKAETFCFSLLHQLRQSGVSSQMDFSRRKLGKVMEYANQIRAQFVAVIGDDELASNHIKIKEMASGNTTTIAIDNLIPLMSLETPGQVFNRIQNDMAQAMAGRGTNDKISQMLFETMQLASALEKSILGIKKNLLVSND